MRVWFQLTTLEPLDSIPAPRRRHWEDNCWYYWGILQLVTAEQRIIAENRNYPYAYDDTSDAPINADTNARNSPARRSNANNVVDYHDDLDDNKAGADDSKYINAHAAINTNTNARNSPAGRSNANNVVEYHDDLDDNKADADDSNYVNAHTAVNTNTDNDEFSNAIGDIIDYPNGDANNNAHNSADVAVAHPLLFDSGLSYHPNEVHK
jgi:hypothetical protein